MKPRRVLQVFTIMDRGGSESMIMNYYRAIDKSKIQFDFLVHREEKGVFEDEITSLGGKIYRLKKINPLFPKNYYQALRAFFKEHKEFSIIHAHLNTFSFFTLKIAKEYNIPCRIAHAHIALEPINFKFFVNSNEPWIEKIKHLIKMRLKRRIHKHITHRFSCGDLAGKWLFGSTPFTTMNNAIDSGKFSFNESISKQYKKELGINNEIIIGHVGRFDSQKNHSFLLKIFSAVIKIEPDCKLLLIGDGPMKSKVEEEAKSLSIHDKIHFLGVRQDVDKLFQTMNAFVFPSLYEGLPVTLIEAQAAGIHVIASSMITNEVEITNLIKFLSLNDTPEFWANKIIEICRSNNKKVNTKDLIIENGYDIFSNAVRLQEFYLQQNIKTHGRVS